MAKRLIIISMILVVLLSVFSIFASAAVSDESDAGGGGGGTSVGTTIDINLLAWNDRANIIQYYSDPNVSNTYGNIDFTITEQGIVTIDIDSNMGSSSPFAFVDVPSSLSGSFYLIFDINEWVSGNPYDVGVEYLYITAWINEQQVYYTDFMVDSYFYLSVSPGDKVEFTLNYDNYSNSYSGGFSFNPTVRATVQASYSAPSTVLPIVWLFNSSSDGGGGYDQGYQDGYEQGYDQGVLDSSVSVDDLRTSLFSDASFSALCRYEDGSEITVPITPNLTVDGCYFDYAYNEISAAIGTDLSVLDRVTIILTWADNKAFDYLATPIYISGDSDVSSGQIWTTNGDSYSLSTEGLTRSDPLLIQEVVNGTVIVNKFALFVGRPEDLLKAFNLYSPSKAYTDGFNVGYTNGYDDGEKVGYRDGRDVGYNEGFVDGKAEGIGIAQDGTWHELVGAVIDAPINAFRSLFNFEILGMDMRLAVGSLLTIVVLLIIIKKLVL